MLSDEFNYLTCCTSFISQDGYFFYVKFNHYQCVILFTFDINAEVQNDRLHDYSTQYINQIIKLYFMYTWVHPRYLVWFMLLHLKIVLWVCFVDPVCPFVLFLLISVLSVLLLQVLITPLVSSNSSSSVKFPK